MRFKIPLFGRFEDFCLFLAAELKRLQVKAIRGHAEFMHEIGEQIRIPSRFSEQCRRQPKRCEPGNKSRYGIAPSEPLPLAEHWHNMLAHPVRTVRFGPAVGEFNVQGLSVVSDEPDRNQARLGRQTGEFGIEEDIDKLLPV